MQKTEEGRRLTNYQPSEKMFFGELTCQFTYKREDFDIEVTAQNLKFFSPSRAIPSHCFLTNSGQVCATMILFFIKEQFRERQVCSYSPIYMGSVEAMRLMGISNTVEERDVLWVCSSSINNISVEKILKKKWKTVIVDSSCWALNEPIFFKLVNELQCDNLFQFRSISKLDMGGVEFGSLGSLLIQSEVEVIENFKELYRLFAAAPSICDIPETLFMNKPFEKNLARVNRIVENTKLIKSRVAEIEVPDHQKYFYIGFPDGDPLLQLKRKKELLLQLKNYGLQAKACRSFGFNFWNIDFFFNQLTQRHVARICVAPSENPKELETFIFVLRAFLARNIKA